MARSEARLKIGCWRTGLGGLSAHAKIMYCVLLTEPTLNHAGVGRTCLALWADNASLTMGEAEKALRELCDGRWVLLDETTHEVFVRTLIRNDGGADQPYVLKGALKQALATDSPSIRRALADELRRLPPRPPDGLSKVGRKITYPDPHATADLLDPPNTPRPTREAPETLSEGAGHSQKGLETQGGRGRGRGGGISSSVGGSVSSSSSRADAQDQEDLSPSSGVSVATKPRAPEPPRADVEAICQRLRDLIAANLIAANGPDAKTPTVSQEWRRQARLMLDADKREPAKVINLIEWCQADPFWQTNIMSMGKFRQQYDQLTLKAREEWRRKPRGRVIDNPDSPWHGMRFSTSESPWAEDMGWQ